MRIAAVLAVASAYGVFIDALTQNEPNHPMLRELSSDENQSHEPSPALFLMAEHNYYSSCSWGNDLKCEMTQLVNDLKLGTTCDVPVPVPVDNYVADKRKNKFDNGLETTKRPFIKIESTHSSASSTTGKVAWAGYMNNPLTAQSKITFPAVGVYETTIVAKDYDREDACDGCIAVRDMFRPQFKAGTCPIAPVSPATLTSTSLESFKNHEEKFDGFVHDNNVQNNVESEGDCGTSVSKVAVFGATSASQAAKCFNAAALEANVYPLKVSPFPSALQVETESLESTNNDKCHWSCEKSRALKEKYHAYSCVDSNPEEQCLGEATCGFNVALSARGNDVVTASVSIPDGVKSASNSVLAALPNPPANPDSTKHVYFSVPCTSFDSTNPECQYIVKLSELLTVETGFASSFPHPAAENGKSNEFVFWRYNLDGGVWVEWNPSSDSDIAFLDASTDITVQAWSACGQIGETIQFQVNLYVHSELTCSDFDDMWTGVDVCKEDDTYCTVQSSDFTLLNLNYDYTKIVPHADNTVRGTVSMECSIMVKESSSDAPDTTFATLVDETAAETLSKNFAVELVNSPHTAQKTTGKIQCMFTRAPHVNGMMLSYDPAEDPHSLTCHHTFHITDCKGPELVHGEAEDVCAHECAGSSNPGVNEHCDGTIVTSTASATVVSDTAKTCCTDCDVGLTCVEVSSTQVSRCEIPESFLMLAKLAAAEQRAFATETTTALLGASAMVAVIALVVVKRRADAVARARESEDAYYPLLE